MPQSITGSVRSLLVAARSALAGRDPSDALAPLLRAWVSVRAPELGVVIERLSDLLVQTRPPIRGATQVELEHSWRSRAETADAIDLGVLLASLAETDSHKARKRLELLARHAPDPRLGSRLVDLVLAPPFTSSSTARFWKRLHELVLACADPSSLARLEQAPTVDESASSTLLRLDAQRRRSVTQLRAGLRELRTELVADERAELDAIAAGVEQLDVRDDDPGPELLAAVFEQPHALERRQVYADYLLGIGDPRGEFIALQLAELGEPLERAARARMNALQREHANTWLGPVGRVLVRSETRFRAGFLSVARIKQSPRGLEAVLDDPIWAMVERLECAPVELVRAPQLRSLRALSWTFHHVIAAGADDSLSLPAITELHVEVSSDHYYGARWLERQAQVRRILERASLLPRLVRIDFDVHPQAELDQLSWLWTGPLGQRLQRIELRFDGDTLATASYIRSVLVVDSTTLNEVVLHHPSHGCRVVAEARGWRVIHDVDEAGTERALDPGLSEKP